MRLVETGMLLLLPVAVSLAGERPQDNQQRLVKSAILRDKSTGKPLASLISGLHARIWPSQTSDQTLEAEICFSSCKADGTSNPPKKGGKIVHVEPSGKNQKPVRSVLGTAMTDLDRFETVECSYCVRGTVPTAAVAPDTVPEFRVIPLLQKAAGFDQFAPTAKEFGLENFSSSGLPPRWKILWKAYAFETDWALRAYLFFFEEKPIAFIMNLNPANRKKLEKDWRERAEKFGDSEKFGRFPIFTKKEMNPKIRQDFQRILSGLYTNP